MGSDEYVMVPREPTEEMLRAGLVGVEEPAAPLVGMRRLSNAYRAMLSAAPPSAPSGEPVAWKWRWNDGQTWMLSESEPDDDGLRVIEPFYLRPSPTRDETIEMCAKWHDEQAAQYDVKRQEWIERGLILAADKCDDLSDNHRRHAASIRSLKSTPDAEGE